uniref:Coiled-coil domain-containing protein 39 n=1 Tax=Poecilia reticulata TaxID=8081 RepID=A0A3P9NJK7_POERE
MADSDFNQFNNPDLDKILSEIGWDYTFALPELSDANRALLEEVSVCPLHGVLESQVVLSYCLFDCVQTLLKANEKELEVTKHLKTLAEREQERYGQLTALANKEIKSSYEKMDRIEKSQLKATQTLEELRLQMDLDQQTMENLLVEAAKKDDDLMVIMKYTQMDEHKIKSLFLSIEKKTLEVKENRKALDRELTETRSAQLALDKTIENIQQARAEIQHLFHLCENTIKQKKQLDSDMERCSLKIAQGRQTTREKNTCVAEMKHKLDTERNNNRELQRNIATTRMQKSILRQELKKHQENLARMQVEVSFLKHTPLMFAFVIRDLLLESEGYNAALQEKLRLMTESALSEEERAAHMEQILLEAEQDMKVCHRDTDHLLLLSASFLKQTNKNLYSQLVCVQIYLLTFTLFSPETKLDGLVNNNLLKAEVKRIRDIIYKDADSMMSWEMRKLELEKAMKEREEEIHVYSEMLRHQLKITEQDRLKLREIRSAQRTSSETLEEQDIKLKELKQFDKSINNMLNKAMQEDPGLRPILEESFQKVLALFSMIQESSMIGLSSESSSSRSHSKSLSISPWVKTVNLNLDLSGVYPSLTSPTSPSSSSSSDSYSSKKTKKP